MALPSGYTKLDYIESSGTQYINTGFKPNQNTRCVIDIENLSSAQAAFFGARASQTAASFTYFSLTATTGRSDYGSSKQSMSFTNTVGRYTVDQNKNVCTANGVTATGTANTFQLTNNLYLMAVNQADAATQNAKLKLYSAKVYDNGTLVRDFIPCKNASGTIGLWDNVNSVFYANAGTGTFSTGAKHKTLIDGTGYEIKSGRVLIAGTGYDIKKGRTLINGVGYDISFSTPVGELPVGSLVNLEFDGVLTPHIVVHQGKPDARYDDSCNGTWLLRKNSYPKMKWDSERSNYVAYPDSEIASYLDNTYFAKFGSKVQADVQKAKIPCNTMYYSTRLYSTNCFLLSVAEMGEPIDLLSNTSEVYVLDYFLSSPGSTTYPASKRIAYYDNGASGWWYARDVYTGLGPHQYVWAVKNDGSFSSNDCYDPCGIRPALIFKSEALVSNTPSSNGAYDLI